MDTVLIALLAAATGAAGAALQGAIARRTAKALGLPTDSEKRILDLRAELIDGLQARVDLLETEKDECLRQLGLETEKREALEHRVDDQDIRITRLLRRLGQQVGE